ncbi:hypothetical protein Tco_0946604 [Tanacetum coccineum]
MDDHNITMEEYIRLEEEKAQRQGRTFDWQTATYGRMEYFEDEDDSFTNLDTEYPAIVFDDTSDAALSWEPTVSPLDNNEIDFKISFDESDDEDYMVVFGENSFSCKINSVDNLKTDLENENDKVNMPPYLSPEPTFGYIDDLDFFKDFENEFPAIVYNDLKSKSNTLKEPSVSSQHINKFEISLSEYDEKEQNVLHFNDSFSLDVIFSNNLKTIKDNDDNINIILPFRSNEIKRSNHDKTNKVFNEKFFIMTLDANIVSWNYFNNWMPLNLIKNLYVPFSIPFNPKRYYKDDAHTRILQRQRIVKRIFNLYTDWIFLADMAPLPLYNMRHTWLIYQVDGYDEDGMRQTLRDRLSMVYNGDDRQALFTSHAWRRLFEEEMAEAGFGAYWSAQYLFRHAKGRKSGARLSGGHLIGRLATHFSLVSDEVFRGGSGAAEDAPAADEGAQAVPAPVQAPQPPPPAPQPWTICMTQLIDANGHTYQAFDSTLVGSSRLSYQRRVRPRTDDVGTSTAPHINDQPDP